MTIFFNPPFSGGRAFAAVFLSWLVAQAIKIIFGGSKRKKLDVRWLFDTGGMPSAHSATVACLATVVGLYYGFSSIPFLIALIFCLITMFDAAGVRRHLGCQGKILNEIVDEFYAKGAIREKRLKELLGHTPFEVIAGATLGIFLAFIFCGWKQ